MNNPLLSHIPKGRSNKDNKNSISRQLGNRPKQLEGVAAPSLSCQPGLTHSKRIMNGFLSILPSSIRPTIIPAVTMCLDNRLVIAQYPHIAELDSPSFTHSRGPGTNTPSADNFKPLSFSMSNAQPVAFPPSGVPLEYVRHKLQREAQDFWGNIETSDCTLTIPLSPQENEHSLCPTSDRRSGLGLSGPFTINHAPSGSNRRATQPALNSSPRLVLHLHSIFLLSSSSFLRGLLSGALPLDLIHSAQKSDVDGSSHLFTEQFAHPINHAPRLLPCSPDHPSIYLPVPDPQSIQAIIYWIYWGKTDFIEQCLLDGSVQWEGLCKNADYLDLPTELKIFLARWHHLRLSLDHSFDMSDEDSDTLSSDYDDDTSSTASDSDASWDMDDKKEQIRGRSTLARPLQFEEASHCRI
ncbi:hypothetical protein APHAL10511_001076 [Amanita phalloides]|nr:hypothetical protein APHAL10511_001076 [Amanita phalloides]